MAQLLWKLVEKGPGDGVPLVLLPTSLTGGRLRSVVAVSPPQPLWVWGQRVSGCWCVFHPAGHTSRQAVWAEHILRRRLPGADLQGDASGR